MSHIRAALVVGFALLALSGRVIAQKDSFGDPPFKLPDSVELKKDVVYGTGGKRDLKLDLFLPKEGAGLRPAVLFIHGGGWSFGTRVEFHRQAAYLASKGYIGACIEYRLSGEAKYPAAVEDCKCAVRWLRANAGAYRMDPDRIAACGNSAGGHLAALLGVTDGVKDLEGSGGNADRSSRVQLVIAFEGMFDMEKGTELASGKDFVTNFLGGTVADQPKVYLDASPVRRVGKGAPPFLFLHGTADKTVPIEQSRAMHKKLREAGVPSELFEVDGADHTFFFRPPHYDSTLKKAEAFLDKQFRSKEKP